MIGSSSDEWRLQAGWKKTKKLANAIISSHYSKIA